MTPRIAPDATNPNCRRIHTDEHGQLCKVYGWTPEEAQQRAEMIARALTGGVYLHLFHGRDAVEEEMADWGFDGPTIGPFGYIHTTYGIDVKFSMEVEDFRRQFPDEPLQPHLGFVEHRIALTEGLLPYGGKFYGDWSINTEPTR